MRSHPAKLKRPKGTVAYSLGGPSQPCWCEVGLDAVGWVEKKQA